MENRFISAFALAGYHMVWKYIVGFLNRVPGIAA